MYKTVLLLTPTREMVPSSVKIGIFITSSVGLVYNSVKNESLKIKYAWLLVGSSLILFTSTWVLNLYKHLNDSCSSPPRLDKWPSIIFHTKISSYMTVKCDIYDSFIDFYKTLRKTPTHTYTDLIRVFLMMFGKVNVNILRFKHD